jgi:predicted SAM-dependent methyltransferase
MDISDEVKPDIHHDVRIVPWPIEGNSVEESRCTHFFEHLYPVERIRFMNELWRVTKADGLAQFITPLNHWRQVQDFDHKWPPIVMASYKYFDEKWLETQKLSHYRKLHGITCDWRLDHEGVVVPQENEKTFDLSDPREMMDLVVTLRCEKGPKP